MAKQSTQPTFESVLDMPANLIERPKPLPRGTYLAVVQGQPEFGKTSQKQTDFAEFKFRILQAEDDVDEEQLEKCLTSADGSKKSFQDIVVKNVYYLTPDAMFMLKDFCKVLGIDVDEGNPRQWLAETAGCQCRIHIKHRPWQSGEGVTAQIDRVMSAE